jgi:hypothetical protein
MTREEAEKKAQEHLDAVNELCYNTAVEEGMDRANVELDKISGEAFFRGFTTQVLIDMFCRYGEKETKAIFKEVMTVYKEDKKRESEDSP